MLQQAGLMRKFYDVIVVIPCDEKGNVNLEYVRRCEKSGLVYRTLHYSTASSFYNVDYLNAIASRREIKEFVLQEEIDFLHSVQLNPAVEMVSRELCIPHLMNIYQMRDEEFELAYVDIFAKYHLCDSKLYAEKWSSHLQIESRCVRPVAPRDHMIKRKIWSGSNYKIVMLGNGYRRKNQLAAIKAIERCLKKYDITLEIAGNFDSSYGKICKSYVEQHCLQNYVHFRGFIEDISMLLEECDFLLCASLDESFPMSIVEAVTYGLTIISTPVAGVPEVFRNKYNAYISKSFKVEDIAESIMECIYAHENGDIEALRKYARHTWEHDFAPNAVRKQIDQYYRKIMKDRRVGAVDIYGRFPIKQMEDISKAIKCTESLPDDLCKKTFYYMYLKEINIKGNAYIWGAGNLGRQAYELIRILQLDINVASFIDRNRTGKYCEHPIIKPEEIQYDQTDCFFICFAEGRDEIIDFLNEKGFGYCAQTFLLP